MRHGTDFFIEMLMTGEIVFTSVLCLGGERSICTINDFQ
jgi:hypothetical protein